MKPTSKLSSSQLAMPDSQVQRLRRLGEESLKRSDCFQAAHFFNESRKQLHHLEAKVTEVLGAAAWDCFLWEQTCPILTWSKAFRVGVFP